MSYLLKQSQTARPLLFLMLSSTDHVTGVTGITPTVTISKNGAAFASPAGSVTELSSGWYKVAGNATDTGTLGPLVLHATGTGADPCDVQFDVVAFDPNAMLSVKLADAVAHGGATATLEIGSTTASPFIISSNGAGFPCIQFTTSMPADYAIEANGTAGIHGKLVGSVTSVINGVSVTSVTLPSESAGRAGAFLDAMRRVWEWNVNEKVRDRATGIVQLLGEDGLTVLETQTQSTTGAVGSEIDTQSAGT